MSSDYDKNVYYAPDTWGLTPVAEIDVSDRNYVFDITAVWRDEDGQLYVASSSGCSCPVPFEEYENLDSLIRIEQDYQFDELVNYATRAFAETGKDTWGYHDKYPTAVETTAYLAKIRDAYRDWKRSK